MPAYSGSDLSSDLPQTHCLITTHDGSGKATFFTPPSKNDDVVLKWMGVAAFNVLFTTSTFPTDFEGDEDIKQFFHADGSLPIAMKGGTVVRLVDLGPGEQSPMHRTNSLDYGVVLEGSVELILEDFENGPRKIMRRGDVSVQRATMHAWRNVSKTEWARMLYVLVDAKAPKVGGKELDEDHGGIELPEQ